MNMIYEHDFKTVIARNTICKLDSKIYFINDTVHMHEDAEHLLKDFLVIRIENECFLKFSSSAEIGIIPYTCFKEGKDFTVYHQKWEHITLLEGNKEIYIQRLLKGNV